MRSYPELLLDLAAKQESLFTQKPETAFLLAEAYRRQGDNRESDRRATQASQLVGEQLKSIKIATRTPIETVEATRRIDIGRNLEMRGLHDWAEIEYKLALSLLPELKQQIVAREQLAFLYWNGAQYQQAAEILEPAAKAIKAKLDRAGRFPVCRSRQNRVRLPLL